MSVMKKRPVFVSVVLFTVVMFPLGLAIAQQARAAGTSISSSLGVIPYPTKGQTPSQQNEDEGQCYAWARQQTGIDPMAVASRPTTQPGPAVGGGERIAGAARGAAGGAAIGAIAGDAGKGAAIGAVTGTVMGGARARMNRAGFVSEKWLETREVWEEWAAHTPVKAAINGPKMTCQSSRIQPARPPKRRVAAALQRRRSQTAAQPPRNQPPHFPLSICGNDSEIPKIFRRVSSGSLTGRQDMAAR